MNWAYAKDTGVGRFLWRNLNYKLQSKLLKKDIVYNLPNGTQMTLPSGFEFGADIFYTDANVDWHSEYIFEAFLEQNRTENGSFCDVGGNIGYYSLFLSHCFDKGYCFEPDRRNHTALRENLKATPHIEHVDLAVSDFIGQTDFVADSGSTVSHISGENSRPPEPNRPSSERANTVQVTTLDQFYQEPARSAEKLVAAKVDIEGYDLSVLQGAEQLIQRDRPTFLIEFGDSEKGVNTKEALGDFLSSNDYQIHASVKDAEFGKTRISYFKELSPENLSEYRYKMLFINPSECQFFEHRCGKLVNR